MIVYDKEQKEIVIPNGIGNINLFNNGVEAGYNQGYEQGQADMAAKARVLNVTENGVYKSKYSDPVIPTVTGVYDDGTEFYNYAELNGKIFNTKIAATENSRLEFWYKGDNTAASYGWNVIIGAGNNDNSNTFQVKYYDDNNIIRVQVGANIGDIHNWDDTVWHHLIISKEEGVWIDGKNEYAPFTYGGTVNGEFFINGIGYDVNSGVGSNRNANGCFGMIKIDDTIIIPTADGFLNTNTGELVEVVQDGSYAFTENPPIYGEGELYKTINVNVPDLNGSYDEGYAQGKTDGINEQKSKLESISITENGTYNKEDGYNHIEVNVPDLNGSYDEGYEQGQADVAANARVLEVTENGVYKSKYSDKTLLTEPTGIYENGDLFFDYAYLNNIQYNTNIYPMSNTKMEIWWKYDGIKEENEGCIIGCQNWGYINSIFKIGWNFGDNRLLASINDDTIFIPFIAGWNHIVMSYADGLWLNGVKIGTFPSNITDDMADKEPICINGYYGNNRMNSDYFGMVKINDVVFIPTENGFLNTSTNELLPIHREGEYTYTSVVPKYDEPTGELYKTINVNVIPKVNVQKTGLKLGFSSFTEVPEWADFEGITNMENMFNSCQNLQTIPHIDTSNVTNMAAIFSNCSKLQTIPLLNTSNVTNMEHMFDSCRNLQTMPSLDTSKVTQMFNMFASCRSLVSIPALNAQSLNMPSYYGVFRYSELPNITDFGGFLNLKLSLTNDTNLQKLPNLTYESCINVLNGLYDFSGNGETPNSEQGQLKVHQNFLDKVGDEISIGTAKGWQITV